MASPCCENCRFYRSTIGADNRTMLTVCKANPPTPILVPVQVGPGQQSIGIQAMFPPVNKSEWCGRHEPLSAIKLVN